MNVEQSVEHELFRGREPSATDSEALLAQYQLLVETSEALVVRRQGVNAFFLSVNSLVLAAAGLLIRDGMLEELGELFVLTCLSLSIGGCVFCLVWRRLITSFRQLSKGKFDVIHALEERLPARVFAAEWAALGRGENPKQYRPFTGTEAKTPIVFAVLHLLFAATVIYLSVV